jgi:hypothetical protein
MASIKPLFIDIEFQNPINECPGVFNTIKNIGVCSGDSCEVILGSDNNFDEKQMLEKLIKFIETVQTCSDICRPIIPTGWYMSSYVWPAILGKTVLYNLNIDKVDYVNPLDKWPNHRTCSLEKAIVQGAYIPDKVIIPLESMLPFLDMNPTTEAKPEDLEETAKVLRRLTILLRLFERYSPYKFN